MRSKICVVTSGRWDYGHLLPVMREIQASAYLELDVLSPVVWSFHDTGEFHITYTREVYDRWDYGRFNEDCMSHFNKTSPDLVLLLGDRFEIHAAASAAFLLGIPVAHIHGGESTLGAFDDEFRDGITMFAKYHFASTTEYAHNIFKLKYHNTKPGETIIDTNIYHTGAPGLDDVVMENVIPIEELQKHFTTVLNESFIIALFHPVTKELDNTHRYIVNLLNALYRYGEQVIFIMPNIDPGNNIIREQIYSAQEAARGAWEVVENVERMAFISLMNYATTMVGNSSAGIMEAANFSLPVVNIGTRQGGRIKSSNVIDVGYGQEDIFQALVEAKTINQVNVYNQYYTGGASKKIVEILEQKLVIRGPLK